MTETEINGKLILDCMLYRLSGAHLRKPTQKGGGLAEKGIKPASVCIAAPSVSPMENGTADNKKKAKGSMKMENKCKRTLSLLLALVMVIGLMPLSFAHAEEGPVYQAADTAATDLGLEAVGDSAKFVIVSAVSTGKEMVANIGTNGAGQTGFELAPRSAADNVAANAVWTITMVENGYTVSNGGLNVAVKADHQVALEEDAVVQIQKGNNGTDIYGI